MQCNILRIREFSNSIVWEFRMDLNCKTTTTATTTTTTSITTTTQHDTTPTTMNSITRSPSPNSRCLTPSPKHKKKTHNQTIGISVCGCAVHFYKTCSDTWTHIQQKRTSQGNTQKTNLYNRIWKMSLYVSAIAKYGIVTLPSDDNDPLCECIREFRQMGNNSTYSCSRLFIRYPEVHPCNECIEIFPNSNTERLCIEDRRVSQIHSHSVQSSSKSPAAKVAVIGKVRNVSCITQHSNSNIRVHIVEPASDPQTFGSQLPSDLSKLPRVHVYARCKISMER